jgi:hypothetical protein
MSSNLRGILTSDIWTEIVERLGGGEVCGCDYLATGAHNDNFRLRWHEGEQTREALVRLNIGGHPGCLESEAEALERVGGDFAPKLLLYLRGDGTQRPDILVEELIQRPRLQRSDEDGTVPLAFVESMAKWYARLHSITKDVTAPFECHGTYHILKSIQWHVLTPYSRSKLALPDSLKRVVDEWIHLIVMRGGELRKSFERQTVSLIQGDPTIGNVFYWRDEGGDQVVLVDWEFSRYDLAEFDLAFFMDTYDLSSTKRKAFLSRYLYPEDHHAHARLLFVWLVHLFRIVAWRSARLRQVRNGGLTQRQSSSKVEDLLRGIEGGVEKAHRILSRIEIQSSDLSL